MDHNYRPGADNLASIRTFVREDRARRLPAMIVILAALSSFSGALVACSLTVRGPALDGQPPTVAMHNEKPTIDAILKCEVREDGELTGNIFERGICNSMPQKNAETRP
jgi:hypothetical protein